MRRKRRRRITTIIIIMIVAIIASFTSFTAGYKTGRKAGLIDGFLYSIEIEMQFDEAINFWDWGK